MESINNVPRAVTYVRTTVDPGLRLEVRSIGRREDHTVLIAKGFVFDFIIELAMVSPDDIFISGKTIIIITGDNDTIAIETNDQTTDPAFFFEAGTYMPLAETDLALNVPYHLVAAEVDYLSDSSAVLLKNDPGYLYHSIEKPVADTMGIEFAHAVGEPDLYDFRIISDGNRAYRIPTVRKR